MNARAQQKAPATAVTASPAGRFLAALMDDVTRETVRTVALQLGWRNPEVHEGGVETLSTLIGGAAPPSFLLADISDCGDPIAAMDALALQCGPETSVVVVGLENDVGLYRRLLSMGVSDYLVKPVSGAVLAEAIQAATRSHRPEPEHPHDARVMAMIGARGGVGTTALAVSAGWVLSQDRRVVILDLDLHFGTAALSLDLEPGRGLHEILTNPDRIDSLLIGAAMTTANDRLHILSGEDPLEENFEPSSTGLAALLADLAGSADCILVDIPRSLNELSRHVLSVADVIVIVTDQSLPAMRDTRRLLALVKGQRGGARALVIANRVGGVSGEIGKADFEKGIEGKIDVSIPFDGKAAMAAAERGKAMSEVARNPATLAALKALAVSLIGGAAAPKASMFDRWLGR